MTPLPNMDSERPWRKTAIKNIWKKIWGKRCCQQDSATAEGRWRWLHRTAG